MTAKQLKNSIAILIVSSALWGFPATGAQACCSHSHRSQPREAQKEPGAPQPESSHGSQDSSDPSNYSDNCFRRYNAQCDAARTERRRHSDD